MTKIAVIGATGTAGKLITEKALAKGLDVTAVVRNKAKLQVELDSVIEKDIFDLTRADLSGFDAVVLAYRAPEGHEADYSRVAEHINAILADTNVWLLVVGGAGSLFLDESRTQRLRDVLSADLPWYPTVNELAKAGTIYQTAKNPWTFFSPAEFFDPEGAETGNVTVTSDVLTKNAAGDSRVSYADYAAVVIDLILNGSHKNEHIGIYEN